MQTRLSKVRAALKKESLDACLISSVSNITYLTGFSNFSKEEREAYILITQNNQYLFTDGRYSTAVKKEVPEFMILEITSGMPFTKLLTEIVAKEKLQTLGIEMDNLTVAEYKKIVRAVKIKKPFSLSEIRMQKDASEIQAIEKACKLGDQAFDCILSKIKPGVSEKELAFAIEFFIKQQGFDISFKPIVAFGKNAAVPHHQTGNTKLKSHDLILLDFGARVDNYCSDMTRTVFFGKAPAEQKRIYVAVLDAQKKAIDSLEKYSSSDPANRRRVEKSLKKFSPPAGGSNNKDFLASTVDKVARDYIIAQGYPSIPHSLGHGIGIDVHESPRLSPRSKDILKLNMVFSIEPGIYLPNNCGIRIEDIVVLEKSGPRLLTQAPKHLIEL